MKPVAQTIAPTPPATRSRASGSSLGVPDWLVDGARRRVDSLGRDVPIDQRVDAVVDPVRFVEIGFEVRLENHPAVAHVPQAPVERHACCANARRSMSRPPSRPVK